MDVGLTDIENRGIVACENVGKSRGNARTVISGYVDEDKFGIHLEGRGIG